MLRVRSGTPPASDADQPNVASGSIAPKQSACFGGPCPLLPESDSQPPKCVPSLRAHNGRASEIPARPAETGDKPGLNWIATRLATIGIVDVAALAACADGSPPVAAITVT